MATPGALPTHELDLKIGRLTQQIERLEGELQQATTPAKQQKLQGQIQAAKQERAQLLQIVTARRAQQGALTRLVHH